MYKRTGASIVNFYFYWYGIWNGLGISGMDPNTNPNPIVHH